MILLKVTIAFALALAVAALSRRAAAATRHAILAAGQLVALLIPLLMLAMPPMRLDLPSVERRAPRPPVIANVSPAEAAAAPLEKRSSFDWRIVWLLGALTIAASRAVSYVRAARVVRRAAQFGDVRISDEVAQPVTLGRHILLPRDTETWEEGRLNAVLLHERAHVARHDSLLALLADLSTAVYWFHPLAWLAARRTMLERERACDEAVLGAGVAANDYAAAILSVARAMTARPVHGLGMAGRSHLRTRITAILDPTLRRRATSLARALVILAALVGAPLLAALTPRGIEPDLLGDAFASPFSELIVVDQIPAVAATGPDAALIAQLQTMAQLEPRAADDFVAFRARWALGQVRNGELVPQLIEATRDRDWRIRAYAAFGLAIARDTRATPALLELMKEGIWRVRAMATTALAYIADPAAAKAMHRALDDDAWQVRSEAVRYFGAVGAERELFERMKHDRHIAVRARAEEAFR